MPMSKHGLRPAVVAAELATDAVRIGSDGVVW